MTKLKLSNYREIEPQDVNMEGARGVTIRWLIGDKQDPPNFQMRIFEVAPDGNTPLHSHSWEHEVFVLEGEGKLIYNGEEKDFSEGSFILVPPGEEHSFINTGKIRLRFLCMVPNPRENRG